MCELNADVKCRDGDREDEKEREQYDRSRHCWTEKLGKWEEYIFGFGENNMSEEKVEDEESVTLYLTFLFVVFCLVTIVLVWQIMWFFSFTPLSSFQL